jgi:4-hydroxybenzoate polyprenyltransferase
VRDIEGDKQFGVKTIPVTIGIDKTKKLLLVLNSLPIPWLVISLHIGFFTRYLPVLIFCIVYAYWYIIHFCKERKIGYSIDLLVDGEWLILVVMCIFMKLLH